MILQRFKLIDVASLPDAAEGNADDQARRLQDQGAAAHRQGARRLRRPRCRGGRGLERGGAAGADAARATTRRCWCSTAPTSAPRKNSRPASPISPRSTALRPSSAPLDDYVGKLPEQGGVLIFCASYNGAAPDNATQFVKWLGGDLPKDAFAKVRYAVFGCGNSDWAATYQSVPRMIDEQLAAHGARSVYARGEGDARSDLDGQFEKWFAAAAPAATKEFGLDSSITRSADDAPLYAIEPVAPTAVNTIVAQGGVAPMKVLVNSELQNKSGANPSDRSTRHIEVQLPPGVTYRVGDHLSVVPRNDPALVDSVARRFGFLPADQIRLAGRRRPPRAIAGRRCRVGRAAADRVRRVAAGRDPQADPDHVGAHALSGDQAETAGLCRRRCRLHRALPQRGAGKAQIGVRPAGGISGLRTAVPRLSRNAVAAGAALLFDLVVAVGRCRALQRHRRRGRGAREFGPRRLQGRLLELSRRPPRRRHHPCHRARDQGRLPPAGRSVRADHHDRPRHGAGAVPRLPAGARRTARPRARRSGRRCCSSAAAIPSRIFSTPTN